MKCTKIQRIVLECDEHELPREIITHLEACPECSGVFRRACATRRLIALKRYEIPEPLRREACLAELHDRLVFLQDRRDDAGYSLHPAFRFGLAAAVVVMVAAHVATHLATIHGSPPLHSPVSRTDSHSRTLGQFLADQNSLISGTMSARPPFRIFPTFPTNQLPARARPESIFVTEERTFDPSPTNQPAGSVRPGAIFKGEE